MEKEIIMERLKNLLKSSQFMSLKNYVDNIDGNTSLINDMALDSIQILELIVVIESDFSIVCEPDELNLDMFDKVDSLVSFIHKKVS